MAKRSQKSERACLRCGCTEQRACGMGCGWVANSNVCDACLSPAEEEMLAELCEAFGRGASEIEKRRAKNRLLTFGIYLTASSMHMPIPYSVVPNLRASAKSADKKKGAAK